MTDHFTLDVDVESLRLAKGKLADLATGLSATGPQIAAADDDLGTWTGPASTKIKAEIAALGTAVTDSAPAFDSAKEALQTFIAAVVAFKDGPLADANREWTRTNDDATDDIARLDEQFPDDEAKRDTRRGEIASGLRYALQGISAQYAEEKEALRQKATTLGSTLGGLTTVPVPESVATRFIAGGGSGTRLSFDDSEGRFPPDLHGNENLGGLSLTEDIDQTEAGVEIAQQVNSGDITEEEAAELADRLDAGSGNEAFRAAFLAELDPQALADYHEGTSMVPHQGDGRDGPGDLLTAIAGVLSRGSRPENQSTYPVDSSLYDELADAYTDVDEDDLDPDAQTKGYLRLSELIAAGQGDPPTWDSDTLAEFTRRTIAYEREQVANDEYWSWGDAGGELSWRTANGAEWYGGQPGSDSKNPYWADPLVLYMEAMQHDTQAAQQVFTNGTNTLDGDLSEYLYGRHAGHPGNYGWALSQALQSATTPVGSGGEGTPDYISASLVSDLTDYYADHDLGLNMEDGITNILTNHVLAVNHASDENTGVTGQAIPPLGSTNLPYEMITRANITAQDLDKLLPKLFGLDYYSNQIAEEGDPPSHDFPLYSQLALAMELSAREEFGYVARHGDPGQLEILTNDLSQAQQRTLNGFASAMEGQGRSADEANADSRAALDFVLGIAKDQIPTGEGLPSTLAGAGLDKVQSLLVDQLIPESDYEAAAAQDASGEEYRQQLTSLKLVKWLDESGVLPQENSPQQWAEENPDAASFLRDGELVDPGELYRNRESDPQAWNDFRRYYENSGRAWLAVIDLDEQYTLGWLEEGG